MSPGRALLAATPITAEGPRTHFAIASASAFGWRRRPSVFLTEVLRSPMTTTEPTRTLGPAPRGDATRTSRLAFLDGIRAVAAVYVVLHHVYLVYPGFPDTDAPVWATWLSYGHFAVAVFIVLSGFSLALLPARHNYDMTSSYAQFMVRRARRIIPPYWVALALSVAIMALLISRVRPADQVSAKGVFTHFFLVQDLVEGKAPNGAFWSIAIEWQLYFFFPLFLFLRRRLGAVATVVAAVVGVWALGFAGENVKPLGKILHVSPQMAALFVMGIVAAGAAQAVTRDPHRNTDSNPPTSAAGRPTGVAGTPVPWSVAALTLTVVSALAIAFLGTPRIIDNLYWLDLLIGATTAATLIALVRGEYEPVRKVLASGPLVAVGHYSYSLYLIHSPLLLVAWVYAVDPLDVPIDVKVLLMIAFAVPLIMAASYMFSRYFERPFQQGRLPFMAKR